MRSTVRQLFYDQTAYELRAISTHPLVQGIGSAMHVATIHLATAMQHGRIFLWAPSTVETPIPEDRQWWQLVLNPRYQHKNDKVRSSVTAPTFSSVGHTHTSCLLNGYMECNA